MATTTDFFKVVFGADDELSGPMANIAAGATKLLAGYIALDQLGNVFTASINGAIEAESAMRRLSGSIERTGGSIDVVGDRIIEFASEVQTTFGIADDTVTDSIAKFIDYGATVDESMALFRQAMDLAAGKTIEVQQAVDALARAYNGSTGMLQRYLGATEELIGKEQPLAKLRALLDEMFGGKAQEQIGSSANKIATFKVAWDELLESIGKQVTGRGGVNVLVDPFRDLFIVLSDAIKPAETLKEKFDTQLKVVEYYNEQISILNALNQSSGPLWDQMTASLKEASHVLESLGNQLEEVSQVQDQTNQGSKNLAEAFAATTGPMTDAAVASDRYEEHLQKLASTWQQTMKMMRGDDLFEGLAGGGPMTDAAQAASDLEHSLRLLQGNVQFGEDGPMSMIWEHEEEASKNALDRIRDHRTEYEQMALTSTGQLTSEIAGLFVGLETDLKAVFRNIARDYITLVLNEILKATAIKLGQQLFSLLFPAQSALIPVGGAVGTGALGKIGPGGVTGAGVVNNYYGDIITDSEYINTRITPVLERQAEYGLNRLALTERI